MEKTVAAQEEASKKIPQTIGPYRIIRELGRGGVGVVYLAEGPKGLVALKTITQQGKKEMQACERLGLEREALLRTRSPYVVEYIDFGGEHADPPYLVVELLSGTPLGRRMGGAKFPLTIAIDTFRQICLALVATHSANFVHRDVNPNNVMVTEVEGKPCVKLYDYGSVVKTGSDNGLTNAVSPAGTTRIVIGTPGYMSPEQARGETLNGASDLFSAGCILYEMLTGDPFIPALNTVAEEMSVLANELFGMDPKLEEEVGSRTFDLLCQVLAPKAEARITAVEAATIAAEVLRENGYDFVTVTSFDHSGPPSLPKASPLPARRDAETQPMPSAPPPPDDEQSDQREGEPRIPPEAIREAATKEFSLRLKVAIGFCAGIVTAAATLLFVAPWQTPSTEPQTSETAPRAHVSTAHPVVTPPSNYPAPPAPVVTATEQTSCEIRRRGRIVTLPHLEGRRIGRNWVPDRACWSLPEANRTIASLCRRHQRKHGTEELYRELCSIERRASNRGARARGRHRH